MLLKNMNLKTIIKLIKKIIIKLLEKEKVNVIYNYDVKDVTYKNNYFVINNNLRGKKVVIATGGKTYPKTGSTGMGYNILKSFGHTITKLYPSLTYLKTNYKHYKHNYIMHHRFPQ